MKEKRWLSLFMSTLALCMCSVPAMASALFSDLGPAGSVYNPFVFWELGGSGSFLAHGGPSYTVADLFTVAGSGSLSVTQIDLAVVWVQTPTFYASIWTDSASQPGVQIAGAYWSLSTSTFFGDPCCSLVSVTGITGVSLTGGQQYFMVLGPLSLSDTSWDDWDLNNQGAMGLVLISNNGGSTWSGGGANRTLSAFDIVSTPEPGSLLLLGTGLIGILVAYRRKSNLRLALFQIG